jgi:periplasmic protein TonB
MPTAKSQTLSVGLHLAAVAFLFLLTSRSVLSPPPVAVQHRRIVPLAPLHRVYVNRSEQHQGGSNQTLLPAKRGAPPPTARNTFIPPKSAPDPKLPMMITVAFDSPTVQIDANNIGDPFSKLGVGALGMRGINGIGGGCCKGIGDGEKGTPGINSGPGHHITPPQLIFKVEPEFSEEARKAKYSGVVILSIEVDATGHARGFRVLQTPGLGLEQKAIDAVTQWRFRPGYQDGKPVITGATVEVNFRLL